MSDLKPSTCSNILRKDMYHKIEPLTSLENSPLQLDSTHTSTHRAFVDWKNVSRSQCNDKIEKSSSPRLDVQGEIILIQDDGSLTLQSGELNYLAVWEKVRQEHGDRFDFVTFFVDFSIPFSYSFWSALYLNTRGISPFQMPFDIRKDWNSTRLQGFHFINPVHTNNMGVYLQEFGHQWSAYVYFAESPDSDQVNTNLLLGGEPGHWDHFMDDGHSPMNYDFTFTPEMSVHWIQRENDPALFDYHAGEGIEYNDLDLYLMGLIPAEQVNPFYYIANPRQLDPNTWTGQRVDVTIDKIINAMGSRSAPDDLAINNFRNAWVLVTKNLDSGRKTADTLDLTRQDFEKKYRFATRDLSSVDTKL